MLSPRTMWSPRTTYKNSMLTCPVLSCPVLFCPVLVQYMYCPTYCSVLHCVYVYCSTSCPVLHCTAPSVNCSTSCTTLCMCTVLYCSVQPTVYVFFNTLYCPPFMCTVPVPRPGRERRLVHGSRQGWDWLSGQTPLGSLTVISDLEIGFSDPNYLVGQF